MLDRSETANLFSENLPSTGGEPPPLYERPDAALRMSRRRRCAAPHARRRPLRAPRAIAMARGAVWRAGLTARLPHPRRALRYAPIAVLVVLVLTNPAGCGRAVSTTAGGVSRTSTVIAPVVRTATVHTVTPSPVQARVAADATAPAAISRPRPVAPVSRPASGYAPASPAAPVTPVTPRESTVPTSPPGTSAPAVSSQRPPPAGQGDEFGFER
jgi:hypothetical protein